MHNVPVHLISSFVKLKRAQFHWKPYLQPLIYDTHLSLTPHYLWHLLYLCLAPTYFWHPTLSDTYSTYLRQLPTGISDTQLFQTPTSYLSMAPTYFLHQFCTFFWCPPISDTSTVAISDDHLFPRPTVPISDAHIYLRPSVAISDANLFLRPMLYLFLMPTYFWDQYCTYFWCSSPRCRMDRRCSHSRTETHKRIWTQIFFSYLDSLDA